MMMMVIASLRVRMCSRVSTQPKQTSSASDSHRSPHSNNIFRSARLRRAASDDWVNICYQLLSNTNFRSIIQTPRLSEAYDADTDFCIVSVPSSLHHRAVRCFGSLISWFDGGTFWHLYSTNRLLVHHHHHHHPRREEEANLNTNSSISIDGGRPLMRSLQGLCNGVFG